MKSCKHCKHDSMCESTKSDRTVCTDGSWEFFESLPPLNIFEIENKEAVDKVYIELLKEEFEIVQRQLEEAIKVIKFYGSVNHWCNSKEFNSACNDFDEVEGYPNLYQGGKKARDFLKSQGIIK